MIRFSIVKKDRFYYIIVYIKKKINQSIKEQYIQSFYVECASVTRRDQHEIDAWIAENQVIRLREHTNGGGDSSNCTQSEAQMWRENISSKT